jgi:hypothetical protein
MFTSGPWVFLLPAGRGFSSGRRRCLLLSGARIARRFHCLAAFPPTSFHSVAASAVLTILAPIAAITAAFAAITTAIAAITAAFAAITAAFATITTAIAAVTTLSPEVSVERLIVIFLHCSLSNPYIHRIQIRIRLFGESRSRLLVTNREILQ